MLSTDFAASSIFFTSEGVKYSRERFSAFGVLGGGPGRSFFFWSDFTINDDWLRNWQIMKPGRKRPPNFHFQETLP